METYAAKYEAIVGSDVTLTDLENLCIRARESGAGDTASVDIRDDCWIRVRIP